MPRRTCMRLTMLLCALLTTLAWAQDPAPSPVRQQPSRNPQPPVPPRAATATEDLPDLNTAVQLTRVELAVLQLTCAAEMVTGLDLTQLSADNATPGIMLERLQQYGEAMLTFRLDNVFDLMSETEIRQGSNVPVVKSLSVDRAGNVTPSVSYEQIGAVIRLRGLWRDDAPEQADLSCRIELSGVSKSAVSIAEGISLPVSNQTRLTQKLSITHAKPTLIMLTTAPTTDGKQSLTTVYLLHLILTRRETGGTSTPATSTAGPQTKIDMSIYQLTGDKEKLEKADIGDPLPTDTKKLEESLGWFGKIELVSRPSILAVWPTQSTITTSWNEPTIADGNKEKDDGEQQHRPASVRYQRRSQTIDIDGRWSDDNPKEGTVKLRIETAQRRPSAKSREQYQDTTITTEKTIQEGKPTYLMGKVLSDDGQNPARRYIICLTARRITTGTAAPAPAK